MAIPAMAPAERPLCELDETAAAVVVEAGAVDAGVLVALGFVDVGATVALLDEPWNGSSSSDGHACPGCSIKLEFFANAICVSMLVVPFGLMTPTMP